MSACVYVFSRDYSKITLNNPLSPPGSWLILISRGGAYFPFP